MKLALCGVHGSGKTTLLNKIQELNLLPGYYYSTNLTRRLRDQGYLISDKGDDATQNAIMSVHRANMAYTDIIMDRSALDCYVYTEYLYRQDKVSGLTSQKLFSQAMDCVNRYNIMFYIKPEFELEDDGVRPIDQKFQNDIVETFDRIITLCRLRVTLLTGTVDQRIEQFKQTLGI